MEKLSWNATKKNLWKLDIKALMKKLQELETERDRLEIQLRMDGRQATRFSYGGLRSAKGMKYRGGDLHMTKKRIACIKTILNVKFQIR